MNHAQYRLLPSVFTDPKIVSVRRPNDDRPTVSESAPAFFAMLAWVVVSAVGTWWFWLRRSAPVPPNNRSRVP